MKLNNKSSILRVTSFCFIYLILYSFLVFSVDNATKSSIDGLDALGLDVNSTEQTTENFNETSFDNNIDSSPNTTIQGANDTQKEALGQSTGGENKELEALSETVVSQEGGRKTDGVAIVETSVVTQGFDAQLYLDSNPYDFVSYGGSVLFKVNLLDEVTFYS